MRTPEYRPIPEPTPALIRWFFRNVDQGPLCWTWLGRTEHGYGLLSLDGVKLRAHRVAYHWLVGPLDQSLTIDHLCRVKSCVRPEHHEMVTLEVNSARGFVASLPGRALLRAQRMTGSRACSNPRPTMHQRSVPTGLACRKGPVAPVNNPC
jgi:HNH endonuclease